MTGYLKRRTDWGVSNAICPELHRLLPPVGESPCMAVPWFWDFQYRQLPTFLHTAWLGYSQQVNNDLYPWSISPTLLHTDWLCWSAGSTTRTQGHRSLLSLSLAWLLLGSMTGRNSVKVNSVTVLWYKCQQGFQAVRQTKKEREMSKRRICFNKFLHN